LRYEYLFGLAGFLPIGLIVGCLLGIRGGLLTKVKQAEENVSLCETRSFTIAAGSGSATITAGTDTNTTSADSGPCFIGTVAY
jgi:hypothetical protein